MLVPVLGLEQLEFVVDVLLNFFAVESAAESVVESVVECVAAAAAAVVVVAVATCFFELDILLIIF